MSKRSFADKINNPREGDREKLHAKLYGYYWQDWHKALKEYLKNPRDSFCAIRFLELHPANQRHRFGSPEECFHENIWWAYVKVDPRTKRVEDNGKRNTLTQVWVEWGPYMESSEFPDTEREMWKDGSSSHDYRCDTGGATFEEAMVNLAHNVWKLYGARARPIVGSKLKKKDKW